VIRQNPSLRTLSGFEDLEFVGDALEIESNLLLEEIDALSNLNQVIQGIGINNNEGLGSIAGLNGLTQLGEEDDMGSSAFLAIRYNPQLVSLDGPTNLTRVPGLLQIENNSTLTSLAGLSGIEYVGRIHINLNDILCQSLVDAFVSSVEYGPGGNAIYDNPLHCAAN
jgi:hypothetical protein